ncbi:MAG: site-2 protease family protein, partial [Spirochaetota bacterium]
RSGDRILSVDGQPTPHSLAFSAALEEGGASVEVNYERDGEQHTTRLAPDSTEDGRRIAGISFETVTAESPDYGFIPAIGRGTEEAFSTLALTIRGIGTLFRGVDLTQAVAGPARIVYLTGEVASQGFNVGVGAGVSSLFNFLSLLSVILCFMNLLPIPVFDGGQIVISLVEAVRRKSLSPRALQRYQMIGALMVFALLIFAITADVLFFTGG